MGDIVFIFAGRLNTAADLYLWVESQIFHVKINDVLIWDCSSHIYSKQNIVETKRWVENPLMCAFYGA